MKKLVELAENINSYNFKGTSRLSPIKLAIVYKKNHTPIIDEISADLQCEKTHASFELMGLSGYTIMRSCVVPGLQIHLLSSLMDEQAITDEMFLRRKKIMQKLRCNKQVIFLYLEASAVNQQISNDKSQIFQLKRVDISVCKNIIWKGSVNVLYHEIIRTWQSIHRFQIIGVLATLKQLIKNLEKNRNKQLQWISVKQRRVDQLSYAFQLINITNDYLTCSFQGFYSKEASNFQNEYSVHWQIMDVFEDLWKQQSEKINRQLQRMPLSYIGECLRMSNCQTLGGFLPQSCFLQVFKPILQDLAQNIIRCLEGAKYKILQSIQTIYEYYFTKTSIKEQLVQLQVRKIDQMCQKFIQQVQNAIYSQINYVYAPSQSFWQMRNIKSSLYSQQQQANIQIKYIGKVYVKKVYDSIRQSIPRYVGQGLLRKVSKYFRQNGLNNLLEIIKQTQFKINLSDKELQEFRQKQRKLKDYDKLYQYFSLKINSSFKIKNLLEKNQLRWKQMYQKGRRQQRQVLVSQDKKDGFMGWIKRLFKSDKKEQKRSRSCQKQKIKEQNNSQLIGQEQKAAMKQKEEHAISQKLWILILNTNRKIDQQKLSLASCEGFPQKLRPAIWYWFSTRHLQEKQLKVVDLLQKKKVQAQTARQIQKDLGRTPPKQLFKVKLRGSLRKVLSAYSLIDEEIRYTQGMNFIVATALATFYHWGVKDDYLMQNSQRQNLIQLQQKSFSILKFLMLKQGLRKIMFIQRQYIAQLCFRIEEKIKQLNINVWKLIEQSGFTCQIIFGPILISGLSTWSQKLQVTRRILDLFICRGFSILYKVIAGIAAMSQEQLSKLKNQKIYDFLRNKALDEFYARAGDKGLTKLFLSI